MVQSKCLPQLNASANLHFYPAVPVIAVDGELLGEPERGTIYVEDGTSYDVFHGLQAQQQLFSPYY